MEHLSTPCAATTTTRARDGATATGKGELSYHYWHGRNAGEAPAATAKVRSGASDDASASDDDETTTNDD